MPRSIKVHLLICISRKRWLLLEKWKQQANCDMESSFDNRTRYDWFDIQCAQW